ncbi:MAG: hypothetical protein ACTSRP_07370 [Candidatus Helarchaeota archaeon]
MNDENIIDIDKFERLVDLALLDLIKKGIVIIKIEETNENEEI